MMWLLIAIRQPTMIQLILYAKLVQLIWFQILTVFQILLNIIFRDELHLQCGILYRSNYSWWVFPYLRGMRCCKLSLNLYNYFRIKELLRINQHVYHVEIMQHMTLHIWIVSALHTIELWNYSITILSCQINLVQLVTPQHIKDQTTARYIHVMSAHMKVKYTLQQLFPGLVLV